MNELSLIQKICVYALPVLFAITLHEVAHGWVAKLFGDRTAEMMGRLTINPLKHIDPVGTVLVPLMLVATTSLFGGSPFLFGWAKPVPVDYRNVRNPKQGMIWISAAGPGANLLMAILWALLATFARSPWAGSFAEPLSWMASAGVLINVSLFALNLIPIPPLDGGRIVTGLLPPKAAWKYSRIEPYGFMILLFLLLSPNLLGFNLLGVLMAPFVLFAQSILLLFTSIF